MTACEVCGRKFPNEGAKSSHRECKLTQQLQSEIRTLYKEGKSLKETARLSGISKTQAGWVIGKLRSPSDALSLSRTISPVLHTDVTKEKMRKSRFSYLMRTKGERTPYQRRWSGEMSNLETWFFDEVIQRNSLLEKHIISHEHPEYPYFIDFAFHDLRVAVEIDGPLHLKPDRAAHDKKKDRELLTKGWRVYRIRFDECNESGAKQFLSFLEGSESHRIPVDFGEFNFDKWGLHKKIHGNSRNREEWKEAVRRENQENIHIPRIKKLIENKESLMIPKWGWVGRVAKLLDMKPQKVNGWMKKFCPELLP